ncbi:MAG: hypothetical protein JXR62_01070 [Bacilli bacterium]|nr:hypothetical protein [Bacilli bacterium]
MNYDSVLKKLENNEISCEEALSEIYPEPKTRPGKRAYFIKMKVVVPEEGKGVNRLLKFLFLIPFPMIFARLGLRLAKRFVKDDNIDITEISKMLKYSKNTKIDIDSKDAQVKISII